MLRTAFSPGLDGPADWAFAQHESLTNRLLERVFWRARAQVLEELRQPYFNAVETFNLARQTERWICSTPLQVCAQEAGKIYATLDYFSACLPLPRRMRALGESKAAVLSRYFCQRGLENLQINTAGLLRALAISSLIPDEWFPEKDLEQLIKKEIRQLGIYRAVEADVRLSLAPGGLRWLAGTTEQTVEKIREKLAAGQPWPVRMVRSPYKLAGNRQAIVYACQEQPGGCLRLEIFEPDCVLQEHALQLDASGARLRVLEIAPPGRPAPVLGLLFENYSPVAPPVDCSPLWLRNEALRRWWRRVSRGS